MAAQITYNGIDPFGIYVPQVDRSEAIVENNGYISHVDRFVLSGFLVKDICVTTWAQYHQAAQAFLDVFSRNFGVFQITELKDAAFFTKDIDDDFTSEDGSFLITNLDETLIYTYKNAIVRNISFEDNAFFNLVPYSIEIDCIRSYRDLGVVEPVDEWTTDQGEDALVTITHRMSCRGVGENAMANAESFITNLRVGPSFSTGQIILDIPYISKQENKNRLTGEYSLTETFLYNEDDPTQPTPGIITYQSEITEDQGETTLTISGEIRQNAIDQYSNSLDLSKAKFDAIDWNAIAAGIYGSSIDKNSVSVQENQQTGIVSFSLVYSSAASNSPYLIDETTISRDITTGRECISVRFTVKVDYGCGGTRFEAVKTYAKALNFNSLVAQKWAKFGSGSALSTTPESKGWAEDRGSVTMSVQYCTKDTKECGCLQNFDYSLDFSPGANQYVAYPILRALGYYDVQNLKFLTRTRYGMSGSARVAKCCTNAQAKTELVGRINAISNFYFTGTDKILEEANITEVSNGEALSFSFKWSVA